MLTLRTLLRRHDPRQFVRLFIVFPAVIFFLFGQVALADSNEVPKDSTNELAQSSISLGDTHTCVIVQYESTKCWGSNSYGELGDNSISSSQIPVTVASSGRVFRAVSVGSGFSCALSTGQEVFCWGRNTNGQLGDGTLTNRRIPVGPVGLSSTVEQISAGLGSVCALLSNASIKCWGLNVYGQLGDNSTVGKLTPSVAVAGLVAAPVSVSVGHSHACALLATGQVQCWGRNNFGQLGTGITGVDSLQPAAVVNLPDKAISISTGLHHSCVILKNGDVQCWGQNSGGKLGNNSNINNPTPVEVQNLPNVVRALSLGESQSCAITNANTGFCWGGNSFGEVGDSSMTQRWTATPVSDLGSNVIALSAGDSHTCAVLSAGNVMCWGSDASGQLGNGVEGSRTSPGKAVSLVGKVGVTTTIQPPTTTSSKANNVTSNNQALTDPTNTNIKGPTSGSSVNTKSSGTGKQGTGVNDQTNPSSIGNSSNSLDGKESTTEGGVRTETVVQGKGQLKSKEESKLRLEKHADGLSNIVLILAIVLVASGSKAPREIRRERQRKDFRLFDFLDNSTVATKVDTQDERKRNLKESFSNPRRLSAEDGSAYGLGSRFVGQLFRYEIFVIQTFSRFRIIRIGLRRWAEMALVSPIAAVIIPFIIVGGSFGAALLTNSGTMDGIFAVSVLLLFSVAMPLFSVLAVVGWFVGRFGSSLGIIEQIFESLLLVVGLGFAPLAMRALIGPTWKSLRRGLLAPTAVALGISYKSFSGWMSGFKENVATFSCRAAREYRNEICVKYQDSDLFDFPSGWKPVFIIFALVLTALVSLAAVWWSDYQGRPIQFLNPLHRRNSPEYLLRREYAENVRVELMEGSSLMKALQYVIAGCTMLFVLWDITGIWTISIVLVFLIFYFLLHTTRALQKTRTVHPAIRAICLLIVVSVVTAFMKDLLVLGTVVLGVACLVSLFLRPRQLWSQ